MSEKDSAPLLGAKTSPWQESNVLESFDDVPRTAKSAFSRQMNA
jgi:solute carrier family 35 protein E3